MQAGHGEGRHFISPVRLVCQVTGRPVWTPYLAVTSDEPSGHLLSLVRVERVAEPAVVYLLFPKRSVEVKLQLRADKSHCFQISFEIFFCVCVVDVFDVIGKLASATVLVRKLGLEPF